MFVSSVDRNSRPGFHPVFGFWHKPLCVRRHNGPTDRPAREDKTGEKKNQKQNHALQKRQTGRKKNEGGYDYNGNLSVKQNRSSNIIIHQTK